MGCAAFLGRAQTPVANDPAALGQWDALLPLRNGQFVTQSAEKIYYSTGGAILSLDKVDNAVEVLSKPDGLSNAAIERIRYHPGSQTLVVVYDNSVIDLVRAGQPVVTLNQVANFANFVGKKTIYDVFVESDNTVLLAANYGVTRLNLARGEFVFTTFTPAEVFGAASWQGFLYVATEAGIYRIAASNRNPENFGLWERLGPANGFPNNYTARGLAIYNNQLYFDINSTVYRLVDNRPQEVLRRQGRTLQYLSAEGAHLLIGFRCTGGCSRGELYALNAQGALQTAPNDCFALPNYAIEDEKGQLWFGDEEGFRQLPRLGANSCQQLSFNSPFSEKIREIAIREDAVWTAAGGVDPRFSYTFTNDGFARYQAGQWTIFNRFNQPVLQGENPNDDGNDDVRDVITLALHPDNGKVYAGSFFEGLVELDGDKLQLFNEKNSSLNNTVGDPQRTRVSGLAFDKDKNLWIANHLAERPVSVLKADGTWQNFRPACGETALHQIAIDRNGYKWFATSSNTSGLIVFDAGKLDDPADDRCRIFNTTNSKLTTNRINCVQADLDGDIWVGTAEGIIIFECSNPFEANCTGTARAVESGGFLGLLLKTEDVQTIGIDGANRKWVGSKNGVFLLSATGEEQLASFTENNSPLLANTIADINVDPRTGAVYIGTLRGINVYQGEATSGTAVHAATLEVYPNPVRPDYQGPIAIRGLARDANVKITDLSGQLVFETKALGGQAIWDGRNYLGQRVQSGVYLVLATANPRDVGFGRPSTAKGKIIVLNGQE